MLTKTPNVSRPNFSFGSGTASYGAESNAGSGPSLFGPVPAFDDAGDARGGAVGYERRAAGVRERRRTRVGTPGPGGASGGGSRAAGVRGTERPSSGTHASRDPRAWRSIWGWGRPAFAGGGLGGLFGGNGASLFGNAFGTGAPGAGAGAGAAPVWGGGGFGARAAASAGSARSTGGQAAGATEGPALRRRERGIERDAGGGTRERFHESSVIECASRLDSRDFIRPSVRAATRAAPSSRARAAKSRRRKAQPGAGTRRAGTTAPRGVLPASSDSLFERRGRGASARASPGRRAGGCASSISSRRVP